MATRILAAVIEEDMRTLCLVADQTALRKTLLRDALTRLRLGQSSAAVIAQIREHWPDYRAQASEIEVVSAT